jgi:hypothetical protein
MAFLAEDGTGIDGANSFVSVSGADSFFLDRADTAWAALSSTAKQAALIQASSYLDSYYAGLWPGDILSDTQGLSWPRTGAYDANGRELSGVPGKVIEAVCLLAKEASGSPLTSSYDGAAVVTRKKLGPLETEYAATGRTPGKRYPFVALALRGIVSGGGSALKLVRV